MEGIEESIKNKEELLMVVLERTMYNQGSNSLKIEKILIEIEKFKKYREEVLSDYDPAFVHVELPW